MNINTVNLLLIEDNAADAVLLRRELMDSAFGPFEVTHVKRLEEAVVRLKGDRFDAILLDLGLPDSQGLATLKKLNEARDRDVPIVVLTGLDDEKLGVNALKQGAEDYLVKGSGTDNTRARAVRFAIERRRAAEAVVQSEERLALAVDAAGMGIYDIDLPNRKVSRSHHHELIFGMPMEQMEPTPDWFLTRVHPDDREMVESKIENAVKTGTPQSYEFRTIWPDGSEHWIETRAKVFRDSKGRPIRILGTVVNVSHRKAAEQAARLRDSELAHLSRVTTMGQMASGLAHELNQPLAAILNYASVCKNQIDAAGGSADIARSAIHEVMNETRRAGTIISRMRSFVRKQQPKIASLDINPLIMECLRMIDFELRHQQVRPELKLTENLPMIMGDSIQIEQVLVNLLLNALEAMNEIEASRKFLAIKSVYHRESAVVQVSVRDSGCGIKPENQARLFEPFFTTKARGMGMGLNICRSIIESLGGRLTANPNPDRGMHFCFSLPVA